VVGLQNLSKCQSGNHGEARCQHGRTGELYRWAELIEQLREADEDTRPAESIGFTQVGQLLTFPALIAVPPSSDLAPPGLKRPWQRLAEGGDPSD
jgi:hypothetical protein